MARMTLEEQLADQDFERIHEEMRRRSVSQAGGGTPVTTGPAPMTKEQMLERISVLAAEMDANEEENRVMQAEIDVLYARIGALKVASPEREG